MSWVIGVDVGGTFTDFFAFDDTTDRIVLHKVASTPGNPAQAVISGLRELGPRHGIDLDAIVAAFARHDGCDQRADPAPRRQGRAGRDRGLSRPDRDRAANPPARFLACRPTIRRRWCRANCASRRLSASPPTARRSARSPADTLPALVATDRRGEARRLRGVPSVLVPQPRARGDAARRAWCGLSGLYLSISSDVQPEFREYERFSTAVLNAYLQPVIDRYLALLSRTGSPPPRPNAAVGINQSAAA